MRVNKAAKEAARGFVARAALGAGGIRRDWRHLSSIIRREREKKTYSVAAGVFARHQFVFIRRASRYGIEASGKWRLRRRISEKVKAALF